MKFSLTAACAVAAILAGCSGTDDDDDTTTTTPATGLSSLAAGSVIQTDFQATRVEYDAANDEMIIESIPFDDDVFEGRYIRDASLDQGAYRAYVSVNGFDRYVAYFDESASGAVSGAIVNGGRYLDHGYRGAMYERSQGVTLPTTTQRAFYNGNYIGFRSRADSGTIETVTGTAALEVDFSDTTVRGGIGNRTIVDTTNAADGHGALTSSSITFGDAQLDTTNGTYEGGLSGVEGSYEGLLANGTGDATETAGIVLLEEGDIQESGTFIAIQ